ncbi:hypothetical protein [Actinoplanes sp. URMC 104]|uniref:hypothetical protein n=1 Tax=Actinoplanes sp. URMC 104 TaxID=3423409 RepID=UPI003F1BEFB5
MKIWWPTIATAVLISGGVLAITAGASDSSGIADDEPMVMVGRERGDGSVEFAIEGRTVRGVYPGAVKQMRTTVVNPSRYPLRLKSLSGRVVASSKRACSTGNLQVKAYSGKLPLTIAAYGRVTLPGTLPITMPMEAPTKCAGVRFTIALSGVGFREGTR